MGCPLGHPRLGAQPRLDRHVHRHPQGDYSVAPASPTLTDQITAGRPRPDLYARCQLPADLTENPVHGLVSWTVCTRTDLLQDGFRSFPSGHSSFAWAGMWYLILYAAASESPGDSAPVC